MIKLRVIQQGEPALSIQVEGDTATFGRGADCDVVLNEPYISKHHARLMKGIVLTDLGSANGTHIGGDRIKEPTLVEGGEFNLGGADIRIEVEAVREGEKDGPLAEVREELERERRRGVELAEQLEQERGLRQTVEGQGVGQIEELLRENKDLKQRLASTKRDLESRAKEAGESVQSKLAADRIEQVRAQNVKLQRKVDDAEARTVREAEVVRVLREQNDELQSKLKESDSSGDPSLPGSASEIFIQLQSRNGELSKRVAELEARLEAETSPAPLPKPVAPVSFVTGGGVGQLLEGVVKEDIDKVPSQRSGAAEEFLVLECARFVRQVERVVTRMAGNFIQLYRLDTMLPDVPGNFRELMGAVLESPSELEPRDELLRYIEELRRWMVVSFRADRQAATRFAAQLREDLSEKKLTEAGPISTVLKIAGKVDSELWRRASSYLKELSPDMVEDRLEKHARAAVRQMLNSSDADL